MTRARRSAFARRLRRFSVDQDGVSAVEFAILLPLMITIYLGSIEITQAVSADRKMTLVAGTIGDLTAQASCVTQSEVDAIFAAGKAVFTPYDGGQLKAVVTSVTIKADQTATVDWSKPLNGATIHAPGSDVTTSIPAALRTAAGSVIWAEASYTYVPTIGKVIAKSGISLSEKIFLKPRLSTSVTFSASTC
jgi:Flp pilus assembly protein TadG